MKTEGYRGKAVTAISARFGDTAKNFCKGEETW